MASESYRLQSSHYTRSDELSKPPKSFAGAIYSHLDNPYVSLFRLGVRLLQLIFALTAGISYAIELSNGTTSSAYIYSQVVFGLTFMTLILDALTLRSYRMTFIVESVLCVLWLALFGTFYQKIFDAEVVWDDEIAAVDMKRMKTAVWVDFVNFLLWLASAIFSTAMCCSGAKAMVRGKLEKRKKRKQKVKDGECADVLEKGVVREHIDVMVVERLPLYEEIAAITQRN